jgi:isocitrate dehydrogenase (NAD+)
VRSARRVIEATGAPIAWEVVDNIVDRLTPEVLDSIRRTRVALKGEFKVGIGRGSAPSVNVELRKELETFANVIHCIELPNVPTRHKGVDIVVIRENTEGEYSGLEHEVAPGITESLKIMTRDATLRIARYAFEYAYLNNRRKVTAVHKANIMKKADGLFLESCQKVAKEFPGIEYQEIIVDNMAMQIVSKPQQFDVVVTPNFYGSLVSNAIAGLSSPGFAPGANIGYRGAIFEQGARHVGLDIAGQDVVNPSGIILSSCMMLRHLKLPVFADRIENALFKTLEQGVKTADAGGNASTTKFVDTICANLK